jgi:putative Ca2+/H+ antiporter (TMEM165/GDT1 family)
MGSLWSALALVFVAELGDKTQLVALGLGARHRVIPVLVGMAIGYGAANLVAVVVGGALGAALPSRTVGIAGGLLFLGFAGWTLVSSGGDDDGDVGDGGGAQPATLTRAVVVSAAVAMFVAEFGDKTQLATLTLAAQGHPVLVWVGATVGVLAAGAVGVLAGRTVGSRLSGRATRIGSAALFAIFGVVLLISSW